MESELERRAVLGAAGAALAAGALGGSAFAQESKGVKIVGIACSPRRGKTTAAAVALCLEAAAKAGAETELIDLGGMSIPAQLAAGQPLLPGEKDDFPALVPKLTDPKVAGLIIGSPTYFSNMSALCKAFLDRCIAFRRKGFALSGKVAGIVAVGGSRNGGQELVARSIEAALMCQDMVVVGCGKPSPRFGALLWSQGGGIASDKSGVTAAAGLGRRVAEVAARQHGAAK